MYVDNGDIYALSIAFFHVLLRYLDSLYSTHESEKITRHHNKIVQSLCPQGLPKYIQRVISRI